MRAKRLSKLGVLLIPVAIAFFVLNRTAEAAWWDDMWRYRLPITIRNNTTAEENVYVAVTIDTSDSTKVQEDCSDLRFTNYSGDLLPHFLLSGCGTSQTVVHINLSEFPSDGLTIYYYYGNPSSASGAEEYPFLTEATDYTVDYGNEEKSEVAVSGAPLAYWKFDEGSGNSSYDTAGGFSAVLNNTDDNNWVEGKYGKGVGLNLKEDLEVDQYISVEKAIPSVKSICFWTKVLSENATVVPFMTLTSSASITGNNKNITVQGFSDASIYVGSVNKTEFSENTWQHVCVTTETAINADSITMGLVGTNYLEGVLDEVRFYDYVLTQKQVIEVMNAGHPVGGSPTPSQTLYLKFNEGYGHPNNAGSGVWLGTPAQDGGTQIDYYNTGARSPGTMANDTSLGAANWSTTSNALSQSGSYATASAKNTTFYYLRASNFGFTIPATATVLGVVAEIDNYVDETTRVTEETVRLFDSTGVIGNNYGRDITQISDTNTYDSYGGSTDPWGAALTYTSVNNSAFGFGLSLRTGNPVPTAYVDHMRMTVYYSITTELPDIPAVPGIGSTDVGWLSQSSCKIGKCVDFNGTTSEINVPNITDIDLDDNLTGGFTVSSWVYAESDGQNDVGQIFSKGTNTFMRVSGQSGTSLDVEASLDLSTTDATVTVSGGITTNTWNHIAMVYDGSTTVTIYINGVESGSGTGSGSMAADANDLIIGGGSLSAAFDGRMDDFKLYAAPMTLSEILVDRMGGSIATFGGGIGPSTNMGLGGSDPSAHWRFEEKTGTTANDSSGNGLTGTLGTGASAPTWAIGKHGNGLSFDGTGDMVTVTGTANGVKTVAFWAKPTTTAGYFVTLTSSANIIAAGGTLAAPGFSSPTIYVDGLETTTITANKWQHIAVSTATGINANTIILGRVGTNTLNGLLDEVKFYTDQKNKAQVTYDYNRGEPIAHYKFDSATGIYNSAVDGNGNSLGMHGPAFATGLPDTGQTSCYNMTTTTTCGGTDFPRQDADFTINPPSYNSSTYTVMDYNTGLEWQRYGHGSSNGFTLPTAIGDCSGGAAYSSNTCTYTWEYALQYCSNLSLDGKTDWRLPNVTELISILDLGVAVSPSLDTTYFLDNGSDDYWSSSTYNAFYEYAWSIQIWNGSLVTVDKASNALLVRCVRGEGEAALNLNLDVGKYGTSLSANGTNSSVSITNASKIDMNEGLNKGFTISAWIYAESAGEGNAGQVFWKGDNNYLRVDNPNGTSLDVEAKLDLSTTDANINSSAAITTDSWHHVAMTFDGTNTITLYVDGTDKGSNTGSGTVPAESNNLMIGGTDSANFHGKIDEFRVYNYEATEEIVKNIYNLGSAIAFVETGTTYSTPTRYGFPDTGQTSCYNMTASTACGTSLFPDQDADYSISTPSYSTLSSVTVIDDNTQLEWQRHGHGSSDGTTPPTALGNCAVGGTFVSGTPNSCTYNWQDALKYCSNLTLNSSTDWRLPHVREAMSIGIFGAGTPSIDTTYFLNTVSNIYWSSSSSAGTPSSAWYVNFDYGVMNYTGKTNTHRVRCVRGGT